MYFDLTPQQLLDLNDEVQHHPDLQKLLVNHNSAELEIMIAEIAAFCGVVLDGYYTQEDIIRLAEILRKKLYERRTGLVIINS